jgi:hypothetical protein
VGNMIDNGEKGHKANSNFFGMQSSNNQGI